MSDGAKTGGTFETPPVATNPGNVQPNNPVRDGRKAKKLVVSAEVELRKNF
jgi:hypothetical protein